ncbi:MAG: hypothetical protein HC911_17625, partial [Chloroflexaceae bacterium]|nr:hypothetical protein [Chloroflexaceae bacterium]
AFLTTTNFILIPFIWYFDVDATRAFTEQHTALVLGAFVPELSPSIPAMLGILAAGMLALPTLIEMGFPILARWGVVLAGWLFWFAVLLDAITDYPRVEQFLNGYALSEWWHHPVLWGSHVGLLFFATIGFEFVFAVTSVIVFALVLRGLALLIVPVREGD